MSHQNWNNITRYIKRKLGVPLNFLELSDNDIKEIIVEDVLPAFSQYVGRPTWFRLGPEHIIGVDDESTHDVDESLFIDEGRRNYYMSERYAIPVPNDMSVVEVHELYWPQYFGATAGINAELIQSMGMLSMNPMDQAILNSYSDIQKSMMTTPTYRFIPPNELLLDISLNGKSIIIETKCVHEDLTTIPSDMYHEIFKPWALAEILDTVIQMRKKYRNLSTPFGEINLNWEDLQQRHEQIMQTIQEKVDSLPPEKLVHIFS